ncbi:hypothetical protein EI613_25165 [Azospirillum sp. 412522]|nr:hypothetical protein [Azospirillum sp. 412522]MBY6265182.1 hypothetical protein [Azospirillum sp. 412522]
MSFIDDDSVVGKKDKDIANQKKKNARTFSKLVRDAPDIDNIFKKNKFDKSDVKQQQDIIDEMYDYIDERSKKQSIEFAKLHKIIINKKKFSAKAFNDLNIGAAELYLEEMRDHIVEEKIYKNIVKDIYTTYILAQKPGNIEGVSASGTLAILNVGTNDAAWTEIQRIGKKDGCWTCGTSMGAKDAANWIADHIPPVGLKKDIIDDVNAAYKKHFVFGKYNLHPSCVDCSRDQSGLVRDIIKEYSNRNTIPDIKNVVWNDKLKKMIVGGSDKNTIPTTKKDTTDLKDNWDGKAIQCHICGKKKSTSKDTAYTADHYPPKEFNTSYAQSCFHLLGLKVLKPMLYPQCIKCSCKQGSLSSDSKKLIDAARFFGITVNKGFF